MNIVAKFTVLGLLILGLASCGEDNVTNPIVVEGKILISTAVPNPDGVTGAAYIQLLDNLNSQNVTNSNAFPVPYLSTPCISGNNVFIPPGYGNETNVVEKYTRINGELVKQGEYILIEGSAASNVVVRGDYAYISCMGLGKITVLNHTDMSFVKDIDISAYGMGDNNPDPATMLIRDNLLYIPLTQTVGGYFPSTDRPYSDLLIIDTDNNEVVKMITEENSGITGGNRIVDPNSIFMDENNDIYMVTVGGWGMPGYKCGILRIKAGETEFDDTYNFVLNTTTIEGEGVTADYPWAVKYYKNGKLYATLCVSTYYSEEQNYLEDRVTASVEIDLAAKTIKKIDLPLSNSLGAAVGIHEDIIVFGLATETGTGFYTYNPITKETSDSPTITTQGTPNAFRVFE
ncbi:MAG: hypothetical protein PVH88_23745 [Ignavibacteria bacterium]|jgi:hypothetical protein